MVHILMHGQELETAQQITEVAEKLGLQFIGLTPVSATNQTLLTYSK